MTAGTTYRVEEVDADLAEDEVSHEKVDDEVGFAKNERDGRNER